MLIVDRDNRHLYELFALRWTGARWEAGSGAFFDLNTNGRRPEGWTSADAAGLAILPGLVRYDEAFGPDEIRHALRVTVHGVNNYVWPASHRANTNASGPPLGARMRLKPGTNISGYPPYIQKIFRAMKTYGLIVADTGSDMYVSGVFDTRWSNDQLNPAFRAIKASDFEFVQLGWRGEHRAVHDARRPHRVDGQRLRPRGVVQLDGAGDWWRPHGLSARGRQHVGSGEPGHGVGAGIGHDLRRLGGRGHVLRAGPRPQRLRQRGVERSDRDAVQLLPVARRAGTGRGDRERVDGGRDVAARVRRHRARVRGRVAARSGDAGEQRGERLGADRAGAARACTSSARAAAMRAGPGRSRRRR